MASASPLPPRDGVPPANDARGPVGAAGITARADTVGAPRQPDAAGITAPAGGVGIPWRERLVALIDRLSLSDLAVTIALALCALTLPASIPDAGPIVWIAVLGFCVPFLWRRTAPGRVAAVVVAAHVVHLFVLHEPSLAVLSAPAAMYAVARWSTSPRVRRGFVLVAALGSVLAGLSWGRTYGEDSAGSLLLAIALYAFLCFGATVSAWLLGALLRQRDESRVEMRRRTEAVEEGRIKSIRLAAQEERARIAREMHDVVAHSLSVVIVQSDGASYALDRAVESGDPEAMAAAIRSAGAALATIGQTARESLADTRRLVAVLRQDDGETTYAPTGGVDALGDLIEPLRAAGLDIRVDVTGVRRPLARTADHAVYRVVQESLTNVIKHAGDANVWVSLDYLEQALMVTVRDDGAGVTVAPDGAGHGLVGMRERVTAVGGGLWAGAAPGGGFVVEARIPYDARRPSDRGRLGGTVAAEETP